MFQFADRVEDLSSANEMLQASEKGLKAELETLKFNRTKEIEDANSEASLLRGQIADLRTKHQSEVAERIREVGSHIMLFPIEYPSQNMFALRSLSLQFRSQISATTKNNLHDKFHKCTYTRHFFVHFF